MAAQRKITRNDVARFAAIRASRKTSADAANDNAKCAYVGTTMNPAMLAACIDAAGFEG